MKKFICLIVFFAILFSAKPVFAQSVIYVRAPAYFQSIASSLPVELFVQPYTNGCYLITAPELAALTGTNLISFGIHLFIGNVYAVANGSISVYLQNTNDVNYSKGGNFPTCISGMTNVYSGVSSIAATNWTTDVTCPLPTSFTYTGGGLYVAFSWTSATSSNISLYSYGSAANSMGVIKGQTSLTSAINTMSATAYRPTFVFGAVNTATNEFGVDAILAPGKVPESLNAPQVVQAYVRNMCNTTQSNVPVSLSVTGVNNFTDTQVIPVMPPGAVRTVTFAAYTPTALGSNSMIVNIANDQNNANNQKAWTQSVTCNQASNGPLLPSYASPLGFQGILAGKFNFPAVSTMSVVRLAISSTGINDVVHGVLLNGNGVVIARTNTITVTNPMLYTFQNFSFTPTQTLQANTNYYIGMGVPGANLSTLGGNRYVDDIPGITYGLIPLAGGAFSLGLPAYYGIEPVLSGSVIITPTSSVVCKGETTILTAEGKGNFIWSSLPGGFLSSAANGDLPITPTASATYFVTRLDQANCTATAAKAISLYDCTGIQELFGLDKINLYPNPAIGGQFAVSGLQADVKLCVYNVLGEEIFSKTSESETEKINLSDLPAACYFLKVTNAQGDAKLIKFLNN